jgi:hypothetical protein
MSAIAAEHITYERAGVQAVGVLVDLDTFNAMRALSDYVDSPPSDDGLKLAVKRYANAVERANAGGLDYTEKASRDRAARRLQRQLFDMVAST